MKQSVLALDFAMTETTAVTLTSPGIMRGNSQKPVLWSALGWMLGWFGILNTLSAEDIFKLG